MDKVHGGTPQGNKSLCVTCRNAKHTQGLHLQQHTLCLVTHYKPMEITYPVSTCSMYDDKRMPSYYQMEQIAWVVQTRSRGPAGFAGNMNDVEIHPPNRQGPQFIPASPSGQDEREK